MTNLITANPPVWHDRINQLERDELAVGGHTGNLNIAPRQLAENIFFLKGMLKRGSNYFETYTQLLASNLPDDSIAVVIDDTLLIRNGYYQKRGETWVALKLRAGKAGADGKNTKISAVTVKTGLPGSNATVATSGTDSAITIDLTIPRGDKGTDGVADKISAVTVKTGLPGSNATVSTSGTESGKAIEFTIPRGDKGDKGEVGPPADMSLVNKIRILALAGL